MGQNEGMSLGSWGLYRARDCPKQKHTGMFWKEQMVLRPWGGGLREEWERVGTIHSPRNHGENVRCLF